MNFPGGWPSSDEFEPDPDDPVPERQRRIEGPLGIGLLEMAQEAHDQARLDAELRARVDDGAVQALDHGRECDASGGMSLRVEEHLDMPDIIGAGALKIGEGEIIEILLGDQNRHAAIIEIEKILQVAEPVGLPQRLDRGIRQLDAVAARQREHQLRLEAALDVNVQLAFGQALDQGVHIGHIGHPVLRDHQCRLLTVRSSCQLIRIETPRGA